MIPSQREVAKDLILYFGSATEQYAANMHAYCLMGNHYHLLMEIPAGNLSQIMHHIIGSTNSLSMRRYRDFIHSGMEEVCGNPLAELKHSVILGSGQFVPEIRDRFLKHKVLDRDLPALRTLLKKPSPDQIEQTVDAVLLAEPKLVRQVKLHLCHSFSEVTLTEIGLRFGVGPSGVTQASQRVALKRRKDKNLRKIVNQIENILF